MLESARIIKEIINRSIGATLRDSPGISRYSNVYHSYRPYQNNNRRHRHWSSIIFSGPCWNSLYNMLKSVRTYIRATRFHASRCDAMRARNNGKKTLSRMYFCNRLHFFCHLLSSCYINIPGFPKVTCFALLINCNINQN